MTTPHRPDFLVIGAPKAGTSALHEALRAAHPQADTLSMGMSDDLEAAIAAGSTLVRVGSAIFGARPPKT